ncbi:uncharacterized protein METZ01_LOCUS439892, partial [marine metagenome]
VNRLYSIYHIRIRFVYIFFFVFSTAILGKMFYIQTIQSEGYRQKTHAAGIVERPVKGFRGTIYDRNGQTLAETIKTYTFWVNTHKEVDKERIIDLFSKVFNRSIEDYRKLLSQNKSYIKLAQGKFESQCKSILYELKDIKGLYCDVNISRYYPFRNLASQVVGYVDKDYKGQFGIERQFDPLLQGRTSSLVFNRSANGRLREALVNQNPDAKDGADIQLTLDANIQTILLDALHRGLKNSGAKSANGVI